MSVVELSLDCLKQFGDMLVFVNADGIWAINRVGRFGRSTCSIWQLVKIDDLSVVFERDLFENR